MSTTSTKGKLLVVDDEPAQLRAMCDTLGNEGYEVVGEASGVQALQRLSTERFDLVLTDLSMPQLDGISFLSAAKQLDPSLVAIVMTGHGSIDTAVAAMKAGAFDYILKPFTLALIRPVLARALGYRNLIDENAQLRQADEMIRSLNATLERCVADRTRQLTEANKELEAFAHSISHDLRGPLRAVNNFSHLLIEECREHFSERASGYADRVLGGVKRMEQLIEDLMRLSRVNAADLRRIEIDVSQMVAQIVAEFQMREPQRQVAMDIRSGLLAKADPQLLRIALENLLGNAWKFTQHASSARIEFGRAEGSDASFYVRDNGAGFDTEHAKDLFIPFRRLHTPDEFPGSGIGLSIVQRIIRKHGGDIAAEGSPGHGATFYFNIPLPSEVPRSSPDR